MKINAVLLVVLMAIMLSAQNASAQTSNNMFSSKSTCNTALVSGNYVVYEARYFGLKDKNPVNGKTTKVAPLEADACVHMLTTAGMQWVVQPKGMMMRWNVGTDGSLKLYARDDCGNPADELSFPFLETGETHVLQTQASSQQSGSSSSSSVVVVVNEEPRQQQPVYYPQPEYKVAHTCGKGCKVLIGVGIVGGAAVAILATHHTSTAASGVPPGGSTGPTF